MYTVINRSKVYESKWIKLYEELLDFGNDKSGMFNKIITIDTSHIVPLLADGTMLMVEVYRHGAHENLLEIPGGFIEKGEKPSEAARRELLEETGYESKRLKYVSCSYTWPGRSTQKNHIFLATGLTKKSDPSPELSEKLELKKLTMKQVLNQVLVGKIRSASTIAAIFTCHLFTNKSIPRSLYRHKAEWIIKP